jgi:hypothetical protein
MMDWKFPISLARLYEPATRPTAPIAIASQKPQRVILHNPTISIAKIVEKSRLKYAIPGGIPSKSTRQKFPKPTPMESKRYAITNLTPVGCDELVESPGCIFYSP